jgi:ATP-dependent Lon protease
MVCEVEFFYAKFVTGGVRLNMELRNQAEKQIDNGHEFFGGEILPLLPLRGMIVFPYMVVPLEVGREKSVGALEDAMLHDHLILLSAQREAKVDEPQPEDIYKIGTLAEIKQLMKLPDGTIRVLVEGLSRMEIDEFVQEDPFYRVRVNNIEQEHSVNLETEALMRSIVEQFEQFNKISKKVSAEVLIAINAIDEPGRLADEIAAHMGLRLEDKQSILEMLNVDERLSKVYELLTREIEISELEKKIHLRVRKQMEKAQKEYYLREQIKAIQKELGDKDDRAAEVEELRARIAELDLPDYVSEKALKEVERLEKMPPMVAEAVVVRNYLDWLLALPWKEETEDRLDVDEAERILNEDHYGLEKVKERILEYLAVCQLSKRLRGPILCLIGPPGVGKTSLAKSVARALGRKFVRFSLGGVRDEAEIRGHRRTYVGAMPGKIIQVMRQAGSKNPVILLDEVDKMSADWRGDPTSALLEVLDPEQNNNFGDHYLEVTYDLSNVLFITTANTFQGIPRPLLDRMEVITLSGYTEEEKLEIAKRHLWKKQLDEHGIEPEQVKLPDKSIREIIRGYTKESGVRSLERELGSVCRKTAKEIVRGAKTPIRLNSALIEKFLGTPKYHINNTDLEDRVGVATGLAWTEVGGEILPVEVAVVRGKGGLILTGKLGEVMRESAQASLSYVRAHALELGIDERFHEQVDLHIHVPEGAVPKDGPSAGITITTAIVSALTGRPVNGKVAMTGEITLRGRVLPIGGLKEKTLAAHRAGIKTVILPKDNAKDLEDIPQEIARQLEFVPVENVSEVLKVALLELAAENNQLVSTLSCGYENGINPGFGNNVGVDTEAQIS